MTEPIEIDNGELEWVDERPVDYQELDKLFGCPIVIMQDWKGSTYSIMEARQAMFEAAIVRGLLQQ